MHLMVETDTAHSILAVIPCNVDVATQTILTYAAEADTDGKRTIGILTKPDLVRENATKEAVMDLVRGERRDIQLGYYVVKNRGADDTSSSKEDRDMQETVFFGEEPWVKLDRSRLGITALRHRLRTLLTDRTKSEFPKVTRDINERLAEVKARIGALGQPRSTAEEQRAYLGNIVSRFNDIKNYGLNAYYTGDPVFEQCPELKLVTRVREMNDAFSAMFFENGHTRQFEELKPDPEADNSETTSQDEIGECSSSQDESKDSIVTRDDLYTLHFTIPSDQFDELHDVLTEPCRCTPPESNDILKHLEHLHLTSRGYEMGTVSGSGFKSCDNGRLKNT